VAIVAGTVSCAGGGTNQDNYVDITPSGTYVVVNVNVGVTPSAPTAGNLRLYKATTTTSNTVVSFPVTTLAALAPVFPAVLAPDGSGAASTVTLAGGMTTGTPINVYDIKTLFVRQTILNGDLIIKGILRNKPLGPLTFPYPNFGVEVTPIWGHSPALVYDYHINIVPTTVPGGIITFTTLNTLPSFPRYIFSFTVDGIFPEINNYTLPLLPRVPILNGLLISEIGTSSTQPGLWVNDIDTVGLLGSPYPTMMCQIYAKTLAPSTTYSFAFMPIFK
jgi:hypothetical protein